MTHLQREDEHGDARRHCSVNCQTEAECRVVHEDIGGHEVVRAGDVEVVHLMIAARLDADDRIPHDVHRCPSAQDVAVEQFGEECDCLASGSTARDVPVVATRPADHPVDLCPAEQSLGLQHIVPRLHRQTVLDESE